MRKAAAPKVRADALVIGVVKRGKEVEPAPGAHEVVAALGRSFPAMLKALDVKGGVGDLAKVPGGDKVKADVVVLVGLGDADDQSLESLRRATGSAVRALAGQRSAALSLPAETPEQLRAIAEAVLLGAYSYTRYLTGDQRPPVATAVILTELARDKAAQREIDTAAVVGRAVNAARDWVNTPANDLPPAVFADEVAARAKGTAVSVEVLDEKQLEEKGYGGILGVGRGSTNPPRLVTLTYRPRKPATRLAFVGKGITFDSGGLSIKPAASMTTMKCDMAGAAAVAAAVFAIAELRLPVQVTGYAALAENMPSGNATRPGDVLTMYGGKTVEVLNTDAEGRLVLADALVTAGEQDPDLVVDVATLTGACVVALGTRVSGVMANDEHLLEEVPALAERAGEAMWPLPITDEKAEKVKSSRIADLVQHDPERYGGTLFAAAFLREFVGKDVPWAHLDIAGPAFNDGSPWGYTPNGGTGAAVRTLVRIAAERATGR
ncbi:MAG: leucyl aminopeptidase [Actinomycetota bacterium]|nr:leucyl aminopeptidase [Actinomycetota bacterium]